MFFFYFRLDQFWEFLKKDSLRIAGAAQLGLPFFNAKELCTPLGQQPLRGERRKKSEPLLVGGAVRGAALILLTEQFHLGRIIQ